MADKQLVIAIFKDEPTAEGAAAELQDWSQNLDIKLESLGILVVDEQGRLKVDKIGRRSTGKGVGIGAVLAMVTPIGLAAGVIGGGLMGALHHKGLGLSNEDRERLGGELLGGKAAVGTISDLTGAEAISAKLEGMGGALEVHPLREDVVAEMDKAALEDPAEPPEPSIDAQEELASRPY
jgi:uncharacterized membrane protein